jgi:hypothetical protein
MKLKVSARVLTKHGKCHDIRTTAVWTQELSLSSSMEQGRLEKLLVTFLVNKFPAA